MFDSAELGAGPYGVEFSEDDHQHYITRDGVRTGKSYPIGKTANRACRRLNDEHATAPQVTASPAPRGDAGAGDPDAAPKAPKGRQARPNARVKAEEPKAPEPRPTEREPATQAAGEVVFKGTREQWLNAFVEKARPVFKRAEQALPEKVHASIGFMFKSPKAIGQCWRPEASADGVSQIFINPIVGGDNSRLLAGILTHELCHAVTPGDKHGKLFGACARAVGLEGKLTQACDGPDWWSWAEPIIAKLGPCPHAKIDPAGSGIKKQSTRLLKCECEDCGFTFRATAKWVNGKALQCPDLDCGGDVKVAGDEGGEGE
jgi:predicted SprT family Zn-dependent metalloprotease